MRIGIVTHVYPAGETGAIPGIFIPPFAQALAAKGHSVWVLAPGARASESEECGVVVRRFASVAPAGGLAALRPTHLQDWLYLGRHLLLGARSLVDLLDREKTDFLLGYWAFPAGLLCRWANLRRGVPYGVWALGSDIYLAARLPGLRQLVRWALRGAERRYANGPDLCRIVRTLSGAPCDFLPAARPLPQPEAIPMDSRMPNLVFAGRLEPIKGPDVLIKAVALLARKDLSFHLWMLGEGSMRTELEDAISTGNLADRVTLTGYVTDAQLAGYLSQADLLVVPSRSESMPLVVTEAARFQVPVVVSDVGDLGPQVRKHGAGMVVPPASPTALAEAIEQVLDAGNVQPFLPGLQALAERYTLDAAVGRFLVDVSEGQTAHGRVYNGQ